MERISLIDIPYDKSFFIILQISILLNMIIHKVHAAQHYMSILHSQLFGDASKSIRFLRNFGREENN